MNNSVKMDEKQLNRLLRRVDWRYLLANPKPEKSVCFSDGLLRQGVEAITTSLLSPVDVDSADCDLAVAVNPTRAVLNSSWAALGPEGEIYTEWYLPWTGGMHGVRRRLEKAGFSDIRCYWAWPPPQLASSLYWLPLDSHNLLHYFFKARPASPSLLSRAGRFVLQMLMAFNLHTYLLAPVCAVARKPFTGQREGLQEYIDSKFAGSSQTEALRHVPTQSSLLLWTPGHRVISKIVAMVFHKTRETPAAVVKIPRSEIAAMALEAEAQNLAMLASRETMPGGIPSLLFTSEWKGIRVVGETFITGQPIYTVLDRNSYRDLALKVTDWLMDLTTGTIPSPRAEWWDRLVGSVIEEFEKEFGSVFDAQEISGLHQVLDGLEDLPLVFEQRDCSPWNILIDEQGEIKVLDWESAEPQGLPGLDLIYFLTYLTFFIEGAMETGGYLAAYSKVFDPDFLPGKINHECQARYCAQSNINPATFKALRLLTWLVHSRHEYRRIKEDAAGNPAPDALRAGLFSQLIREEIRLHHGE